MKNSQQKLAPPIDLTASERERLASLEQKIDTGARAFIDVGSSLREIRDTRLYREINATFEEYVQNRFGIQRGHAYCLISAVNVVDVLAQTELVAPANEYQVRPLAKLSPENQIKAWSSAVDAAGVGKITHDLVALAVADIEGKSEPDQFIESEETALSYPPSNHDYWYGSIVDHVGKIDAKSVDLVLVTNLSAKTLGDEAAHLDALLEAVDTFLKADSQALIFVDHWDQRLLLDVAEKHGYDIGVPIIRDRLKGKSTCAFSFLNAAQIVLHLRKGKAKLFDRVSNIIAVEDESPRIHASQKPVALLSDLIASAVPPGAVVLDPTAGIGSSVLACRLIGRRCIAIESNPKTYALGVKSLSEYAVPPGTEDLTND